MNQNQEQFHEKLLLENFTAFERAEFDFVPGVNAIIGENGTGKTHILKALYSAQLIWLKNNGLDRLESIFQVEDSITDLVRSRQPSAQIAKISGRFGERTWSFRILNLAARNGAESSNGSNFGIASSSASLSDKSAFVVGEHPPTYAQTPVFIPAIDMMGHTKGFLSTFDNYKIDFDLTHREIVSLLLSPEKRELSVEASALISSLTTSLGGTVALNGERFFLHSGARRLAMPSVAEGLRKIATLVRLVQTGWITPGSTLYWDEPEVNLNPILMDEVVAAVLAIARTGVQVFLATHSYVILKELEVQSAKTDSLRFFSLEASETGSRVHPASTYLDLHPNKIKQQYGDLYGRGIDKAMGASVEG